MKTARRLAGCSLVFGLAFINSLSLLASYHVVKKKQPKGLFASIRLEDEMSETDSLLQERAGNVVHSTFENDQVKAILGFEQAVLTNATREAFKKLKAAYHEFQPKFSFGMLFYIFLVGEVRKNLNETEGWESKDDKLATVEKNGVCLTFSRGDKHVGSSVITPSTQKDYPSSTLKFFNVQSRRKSLFTDDKEPSNEDVWVFLYRYTKDTAKFEISKPIGYSPVKPGTGVLDRWAIRIIIDDFNLEEGERQFLELNEKAVEEEYSLEEK